VGQDQESGMKKNFPRKGGNIKVFGRIRKINFSDENEFGKNFLNKCIIIFYNKKKFIFFFLYSALKCNLLTNWIELAQ
jgi:hypothetical protein